MFTRAKKLDAEGPPKISMHVNRTSLCLAHMQNKVLREVKCSDFYSGTTRFIGRKGKRIYSHPAIVDGFNKNCNAFMTTRSDNGELLEQNM